MRLETVAKIIVVITLALALLVSIIEIIKQNYD